MTQSTEISFLAMRKYGHNRVKLKNLCNYNIQLHYSLTQTLLHILELN